MNISSITILIDDGPILAVLSTPEQIKDIFSSYKHIAPDNTFVLNDSVYATENISLTFVEEAYFQVDIFVKFESLISDVPHV